MADRMEGTVPEGGARAGGGDLVDDRYALRGLLGSGGMAEVYLAYDAVLDRAVALKMMHGRYADPGMPEGRVTDGGSDPSISAELRREVVERFRREARAAAGLSHPSIVAVYDQGSGEDGTPYIAMEYVPGGTLKDRIRRYGAIPPLAAAETALQIANALAAAHEQGMIHRDIKPHNILITASGDVKVTDFGIALATAGAAAGAMEGASAPVRPGLGDGHDLTATGVVMGTAGYISPEQALGEPAGPAGDLYSLGVTLYEMLTGELPFRAETAMATAVKHVGEPPRPPREVNPAVPPGLDAVTRRLLEKDPRGRYPDAGSLAADLQRILDEPTPEGSASGTKTVARPSRGRRKRGRGALATLALVSILGVALAAYAWAYAPAGGFGSGEVARGPLGGIRDVLEGVPGPVGGSRASAKPEAKKLPVPDVVGMPLEEARGEGSPAEGLKVVEEGRVASGEPAGVIVGQEPAPAPDPDAERRTVEEGSEISVMVSKGQPVEVPDLVGDPREEADEALRDAGLEGAFREERSDPEGEGSVVRQSPGADERAERGSEVTVTVGTGPAEVETPDVRGSTLEAARALLEEAGLRLGETEHHPSGETKAGDLYAQDPAAGETAEAGAAVDVSVSIGPPPVEVPDVVGLDLDDAKRAMLDAGLGYTAVEAAPGQAEVGTRMGSVISTNPAAGTELEREDYVELVYAADIPEVTSSASFSASPPASPPASSADHLAEPSSEPSSEPAARPSESTEAASGPPPPREGRSERRTDRDGGTPPITSDGGRKAGPRR
ncbi:PASTA domain-containing protein (plasmid) [Rubrobacter tropicus]|uniref:non-specific serine/threonine protein kinase n=1 Tax=Rubrobacter tropicus TaxID=2653851 RepID=A0A6G8QG27_9ACTN|nr:Stk1 family PASTA domain-containing Ser/Thr kinase [Rubrobacter tropicus]QIN85449.1 PASTA domain-containing protein [Rubrobacter tropicus]